MLLHCFQMNVTVKKAGGSLIPFPYVSGLTPCAGGQEELFSVFSIPPVFFLVLFSIFSLNPFDMQIELIV